MEKLLNEILAELKEIKASQLAIMKEQESLKQNCVDLKRDVTNLKDGQQEKNTLIKHTLTLQIENMLEIRNALRTLEQNQKPSVIPK
jgi:peptidoglycan hydrolase CwlO-like protein